MTRSPIRGCGSSLYPRPAYRELLVYKAGFSVSA